MLPSQEQPEPKSEVLEMRQFMATSAIRSGVFAVSSMTSVALPAPEPNAGVPEE